MTDWFDDLLESLLFTYQYNELTAQEKQEKLTHIQAQNRANSKTYRKNHPDLVKKRSAVHQKNRTRENPICIEDIRNQVLKQQGFCFWCEKPLDKDCEVDHIIPLIKGGSNTPENIVIVHERCNRKKYTKVPKNYKK